MKNLDITKCYYIGDLNEIQKNILFEWLQKNCRNWVRYMLDDALNLEYADGECCYGSNKEEYTNTINMLKLFKDTNNVD